MPNQLLFLAHTKQQVSGCRYFLLKYLALYNLKPPADTTIVIYTNEPVAFEGFTNFITCFEMRDFSAPEINVSKTKALHHLLQHSTGPFLYCNASTYPLQALEPLFGDIKKGNVYLHAPQRYGENDLNKVFRKSKNSLDKTEPTLPQARTSVWHAAVIGITSQNNSQLEKLVQEETGLENDLATDVALTKHFSDAGRIKSSAKYIFNYEALKEFSQLLDVFFTRNEEESIPNQVKLAHHIDAAEIQKQKEQFQQLPLFKKWLHLITGKRWSIQQYTTKF